MIEYDNMTGRDLDWYYRQSWIMARANALGYIPVQYTGLDISEAEADPESRWAETYYHEDEEEYDEDEIELFGVSDEVRMRWDDMPLAELDDAGVRLSLRVPEAASVLRPSLRDVGVILARPTELFAPNEEFITYRPTLGYVSYGGVLYLLRLRNNRRRNKGLVFSGSHVNCEAYIVSRGHTDDQSQYLQMPEAGAVLGLCARLSGIKPPTLEQYMAGDTNHAILEDGIAVYRTGSRRGVYIDGTLVGTIDDNGGFVPTGKCSKVARNLVTKAMEVQ